MFSIYWLIIIAYSGLEMMVVNIIDDMEQADINRFMASKHQCLQTTAFYFNFS